MQEVILELEKREVLGKAVKNVRKAGYVPAVIHDHGKPSIVVQAEYQAIANAFQAAGKHHPVKISADGKNYTAIIKSVTFDPRYNSLNHVVFNAVKANEKVVTSVPIRIRLAEGNDATPAERSGLMVIHNVTTVEIEATPSKLPDVLEFDGEKLVEVGDHATVADLDIPAGVTLKGDEGQTIATVFEPSAVAAANDAAGGAAEAEVATESTEEGGGPAETVQTPADKKE